MSLYQNILTSWIAHLALIAMGFYMLPFVRNTLAPEGAYGVWIFINMISAYAALLYLGFGATVCRYVAKHAANEEWTELNKVTSTIFAVYFSMAGVVLLFAAAFSAIAPFIDRWGAISVREIQAVILINGLTAAIGMAFAMAGLWNRQAGVPNTP